MRNRFDAIAGALLMTGLAAAAPAPGADSKPPADLIRLERSIGLRVAHVRDAGPVEPDQRKLYLEAQQYDASGEQALKAGDYGKAKSCFIQARDRLDRLGI